MKAIAQILVGAAIVAVLGVAALPVFAQTIVPSHVTKPAPGPIVGAGLPVLAVGFGVYWLVRRSRRKPN
jgi:hypothetical protein